ncbi:hypothetical protein HK102_011287, partial [Quaeritorhiza haematococci]
MIGNPQAPTVNPTFLLDLLLGPVVAIKLNIVAHYAIGLGGMYWCGRQYGLSRLASAYAAGTFLFSTWLALHLHSGHLWCLTATYIPWIGGLLHGARRRWSRAVLAGAVVALMVLEGGGAHVLPLVGFATGLLSLCWAIQERSLRPIVALVLMGAFGMGLSAFKLLPAVKLLRDNPRYTAEGGQSWSQYAEVLTASPADLDRAESVAGAAVAAPASIKIRPSGYDLPAFLLKVFLGRDQQSDTSYFPIQGFGWQEYGTYLGPLAILLLAASPLVLRTAWPWIVVAAFCFLTAVGNFAPFAPWALLHKLPVFSNMRVPSRFLMPCAFAACLLAGMVLDAIRHRLDARVGGHRRWVVVAFGVLVAVALVDSMIVGRRSLRDSFPLAPPPILERQPAIVTIPGQMSHTTEAMLANYCVLKADEVIPFPIRVVARDEPGYRGEFYFVPDDIGRAAATDRVVMEAWSPNSARVRAVAAAP